METKHTPGPWHKTLVGNVASDRGQIIAHCQMNTAHLGSTEGRKEIYEANARLIAAVPELLEALELLFESAKHCDPFFENRWSIASDKVKSVIAKAKGK